VQDTFLNLYPRDRRFSGPFDSGLAVPECVINVSYDLARKRQREPDVSQPSGPGRKTIVRSKVVIGRRPRADPSKPSMCFCLFEVEGLKHSEIASGLEMPKDVKLALRSQERTQAHADEGVEDPQCRDLESRAPYPVPDSDMLAHREECSRVLAQLHRWNKCRGSRAELRHDVESPFLWRARTRSPQRQTSARAVGGAGGLAGVAVRRDTVS